jgi:hypothetical protein
MSSTLPVARDEFITAMNRETVRTERPRFTAVLDAMIAWSLARPDVLRFHEDESHKGVVAFERVDTKVVFWTATPRKRDVPRLQLLPRAARALSADERAAAVSEINAHSREELGADDPLRIGFGALKNNDARAAVLKMMEKLLVTT